MANQANPTEGTAPVIHNERVVARDRVHRSGDLMSASPEPTARPPGVWRVRSHEPAISCWAACRWKRSICTTALVVSHTGLSQRLVVGLCSAAVIALCQWAFNEAGFHRVELDHSIANAASCRVAAKAGFRQEGIRRG